MNQHRDEGISISFERSGGFAGISLRASMDTAQLSSEESTEVTKLIGRVDLDRCAHTSSPSDRASDQFQYDLVITCGNKRHELSLAEGAVPAELRPLLNLLVQWAKRR